MLCKSVSNAAQHPNCCDKMLPGERVSPAETPDGPTNTGCFNFNVSKNTDKANPIEKVTHTQLWTGKLAEDSPETTCYVRNGRAYNNRGKEICLQSHNTIGEATFWCTSSDEEIGDVTCDCLRCQARNPPDKCRGTRHCGCPRCKVQCRGCRQNANAQIASTQTFTSQKLLSPMTHSTVHMN